ncbi:hypothetical protein KUW15_12635 [Qipengyuania aquimaris]|uniref:hypothetical protein n=1 Tax=Qipengyuania aquimaris TaxID=255984 RepID=UPI001C9635AE|nr:hypothetical protein [Qipengyuania aquimaris]MBY6129562.1 hypothetical protein [Qipengyuania aquimaris]
MNDIPVALAVFIGILGLILVLAGISHAKLRILRRRAYAGGRERRGTVRYLKPLGEDDALAYLVFANSHSEWLMSVDTSSIRKVEGDLSEGVAARAYLGDDDKIYGLDIGKVKALPISVGEPFEGKLKERIEWAERKKAELAERAASD